METYTGHVRTPNDAIILFEACRIGQLPRVQRRLSEKERQQIKSGSVFVWDEREAGMRRWTDGKSWSASRVSGSFLTYREMEGKRGGSGFSGSQGAKKGGAKNADGKGDSDEDGPDGYRYKPDGLMKQSFSITTANGQHLHLISYYSRSHSASQNLMQPTNDPQLRHIRPQKGMYPETTVNETSNVPAVTRGPMPGSPYASSPHTAMAASPYNRPPPGHPAQYAPSPPAYANQQWPPSPMATPPTHYSPYGQTPPMPPHGQSPMQHPQGYYSYPYSQPPPATAFDRPPPPLSSSALPPPPPHSGPPSHHPPHHISHAPPPRPPPGPSQSHPLHANPYGNLDPRLTNPMPTSAPEQHPGSSPRSVPAPAGVAAANGSPSGSPAAASRHSGPPRDALPAPDTSASTSNGASKIIPSIGALINNDQSGGPADSRSDRSASRGGSKSPNMRAEQEVKPTFGEDRSALRRLDRAFAA